MIQELLDWLCARTMELAVKGKRVRKIAPSAIVLIAKPPFRLSAEVVEGLIEGVYEQKQLLSKQFADNWNAGTFKYQA